MIVPDLCVEVFVGGHVWRYRYARFGGSPHGALIPKSWTDAAGVLEFAYDALFLTLGTIAEG